MFSANFDGMIAACDPTDSWVCKWQVRHFLGGFLVLEALNEEIEKLIN